VSRGNYTRADEEALRREVGESVIDDLSAFLNARLDEKERSAGEIHNRHDCDFGLLETFGECSCGCKAQVLREVTAMRAILDAHSPRRQGFTMSLTVCTSCGFDDGYEHASTNWPCETVLILAAIWNGHPDYRAGWKP
jgi:hypothetical protein